MTSERLRAGLAPVLGMHMDEVLADVMGLSQGQIACLHDRGIVAGRMPA